MSKRSSTPEEKASYSLQEEVVTATPEPTEGWFSAWRKTDDSDFYREVCTASESLTSLTKDRPSASMVVKVASIRFERSD